MDTTIGPAPKAKRGRRLHAGEPLADPTVQRTPPSGKWGWREAGELLPGNVISRLGKRYRIVDRGVLARRWKRRDAICIVVEHYFGRGSGLLEFHYTRNSPVIVFMPDGDPGVGLDQKALGAVSQNLLPRSRRDP